MGKNRRSRGVEVEKKIGKAHPAAGLEPALSEERKSGDYIMCGTICLKSLQGSKGTQPQKNAAKRGTARSSL